MSIIQIIKEQMNMTERERDICRYILENPEKIEEMSSRELGHATFTSAASVTRFCQKIGVKGFPAVCPGVENRGNGRRFRSYDVGAGKCGYYGSESGKDTKTGGGGDE